MVVAKNNEENGKGLATIKESVQEEKKNKFLLAIEYFGLPEEFKVEEHIIPIHKSDFEDMRARTEASNDYEGLIYKLHNAFKEGKKSEPIDANRIIQRIENENDSYYAFVLPKIGLSVGETGLGESGISKKAITDYNKLSISLQQQGYDETTAYRMIMGSEAGDSVLSEEQKEVSSRIIHDASLGQNKDIQLVTGLMRRFNPEWECQDSVDLPPRLFNELKEFVSREAVLWDDEPVKKGKSESTKALPTSK